MNSNALLKVLPPYQGQKQILVGEQSLKDVIGGVVNAASRYKDQYRNIWPYFEGDGVVNTARNVWNYCKSNLIYDIEPDNRQTVKTPAAIIATKKNDCKNYALFSSGVMQAYRDAIKADFDIYLRFAGYNDNDITHVFCVIKYKGKEYWIDPVLNKFNDRSQEPTKQKDYKLQNMALIALSGINPYINDKSYFVTGSNPVPGSAVGADGKGKQKVIKAAEEVKKVSADDSDLAKAANFTINVASGNLVAAGAQLVDTLISLFGKKDSPGDYWKAWDSIDQQYGNPRGAQVQHWILFDGDSVQNEGLNIVSYIQNNDPDLSITLGKNSTTLRDAGRYVTFDDLLEKLRRGGYASQADQLNEIYNSLQVKPDSGSKAGTNMFVTLALVGAAAFLLLKKK